MNKYINLLLFGFLLFIIGLIIVNFDLKGYKYVNYLPSNFKTSTEVIKLNVENNKKYKVKKAKNQQNIIIEKEENNIEENVITIEINHTETSKAYGLIKSFDKNVDVILYNDAVISKVDDLSNIYDLFVKCIKDKTVYNYNLLKYSRVKIKGSKETLKKIEVDDYVK